MPACLDSYPWQSLKGCGSMAPAMFKDRLLPDEIVELAVPVIKQTANTYDGSNTIIETEDKFWIKSEKELYGRNIFSAPGEGHWYEYYRQEDVPWGKKRNGSDEYTLLRSPLCNYGYNFCLVTTNGNATTTARGIPVGSPRLSVSNL